MYYYEMAYHKIISKRNKNEFVIEKVNVYKYGVPLGPSCLRHNAKGRRQEDEDAKIRKFGDKGAKSRRENTKVRRRRSEVKTRKYESAETEERSQEGEDMKAKTQK